MGTLLQNNGLSIIRLQNVSQWCTDNHQTCSIQTSRPVLCKQERKLGDTTAEWWGIFQHARSMILVMETQYSYYEITFSTLSQAVKWITFSSLKGMARDYRVIKSTTTQRNEVQWSRVSFIISCDALWDSLWCMYLDC
jgi:hypothetical protein